MQNWIGAIRSKSKRAGVEILEKVLWLYFASQSPNTPKWAKRTIYAALAYFISPVDAVPDPIPLAGYMDDAFILLKVLSILAFHIDDEARNRTTVKLSEWFGPSFRRTDVGQT
jgi:uncharacterized membrane protein YkvA (DUF1232 family)